MDNRKQPPENKLTKKGASGSPPREGVHPSWWNTQYASRWERVKGSFRKAWAAAKDEFSHFEGHGQKPASDPKAVSHENAPVSEESTAPAAIEAPQAGSGEGDIERGGAHAAEAEQGESSIGTDDTLRSRVNDDAWTQAEEEGRYGFSARAQYPEFSDWSEELEHTLRGEWERMHPQRPFADAHKGIRRGWEFYRPTKH